MVKGRRKETYYERWRREHPELRLYLSQDEYNALKSLADKEGVSIKELVLKAIKENIISGPELAVRFVKLYVDSYEKLSFGKIVRKVVGKVEKDSPLLKSFKELEKTLKNCMDKSRSEGFREGINVGIDTVLDNFIDNPYDFYKWIMKHAKNRKLNDFDPMLFTITCDRCLEPLILTHKSKEYAEIKQKLSEALKHMHHDNCYYHIRLRIPSGPICHTDPSVKYLYWLTHERDHPR